LLIKNIVLLQKRMEKNVKTLKEKMKKDIQKERERRRRELQNLKVKFPTHTKNMYHSTRTLMCTTLLVHSFNPVLFSCLQTPYSSSRHYNLFLAF